MAVSRYLIPALQKQGQDWMQGRQQQQQQQQQQQKMQQEIQLALIKEQIKTQAQQQAREANLKIFQQMQEKGLFGGQNVNIGTNISMKPEERGLRERPIPSLYPKGISAEGVPQLGIRTPEQQRAQQFQQQAGIWQRAQQVPSPSPALVGQSPEVIRRALLARGQRQRLGPQFAGRPISRTATGQYSVGAPRAQKFLEKLPPVTNEQIVTKKGILGTPFGRQTAPQWTANEFKVIQNINTKEDIAELRRDWKKYQKAGVNAQKIIDWFMIPTNVAGTRGRLGTL